MKLSVATPLLGLALLAAAQRQDQPRPNGAIHGTAIGHDGKPAMRVGLTAQPLGAVAIAGLLPHVKTNDAGEFRFQNLPWWGKYIVYADDEDAGYSMISTSAEGHSVPPDVDLAPEYPEASLTVYLPPKAGFLQIRLTNRKTGGPIPGMRVTIMPIEKPKQMLFSTSCYSDHIILVPPDKNLLLHVTSDGFREWEESVGDGKLLNVPSGDRLTFDVQLDPSD